MFESVTKTHTLLVHPSQAVTPPASRVSMLYALPTQQSLSSCLRSEIHYHAVSVLAFMQPLFYLTSSTYISGGAGSVRRGEAVQHRLEGKRRKHCEGL